LLPPPARGVAKEIVQLQRDVALLQQQVRDLQASVDKNNAVLKTLVEQSLDAVNRMGTTVNELDKSVRESQGTTNTRVDAMATQVQSLRDAVDEMAARLGRMAQQLSETQSVLQSVDARLAPPAPATPETGTAAGAVPAAQPPPSAKALYDNAHRDFLSGKYDLAWQQFSDYLKYYARSELAGNAQFYLGEIRYRQEDYRGAIEEYDKVLASYPASFKVAAAQFKKGYALLELNERDAGVQALKTLVEKYPRSEEARLARERLQRLGETP
jgi:tol-pal system protein YbgF